MSVCARVSTLKKRKRVTECNRGWREREGREGGQTGRRKRERGRREKTLNKFLIGLHTPSFRRNIFFCLHDFFSSLVEKTNFFEIF